jgi:hypothetical protein
LSDALCRLSTGGGFSTRQLFTDDDEFIVNAQRPVALNGINEVVTRGDLLDRALVLTLANLERVEEESAFWRRFTEAHPLILGAALDAVSVSLRHEEGVELQGRHRMADFCRAMVACEDQLPLGGRDFESVYESNRSAANEVALEASPVAVELIAMLEDRPDCTWHGTPKDLLRDLEARLDQRSDGRTSRMDSWPKTPRGLG